MKSLSALFLSILFGCSATTAQLLYPDMNCKEGSGGTGPDNALLNGDPFNFCIFISIDDGTTTRTSHSMKTVIGGKAGTSSLHVIPFNAGTGSHASGCSIYSWASVHSSGETQPRDCTLANESVGSITCPFSLVQDSDTCNPVMFSDAAVYTPVILLDVGVSDGIVTEFNFIDTCSMCQKDTNKISCLTTPEFVKFQDLIYETISPVNVKNQIVTPPVQRKKVCTYQVPAEKAGARRVELRVYTRWYGTDSNGSPINPNGSVDHVFSPTWSSLWSAMATATPAPIANSTDTTTTTTAP